MYGAILGDIIGSPFEFDRGDKTKNFDLFSEGCGFTDDSVMTIAVGEALLAVGPEAAVKKIEDAVASNMQDWGKRYPHAGYGGCFRHWLKENNPKPYGSIAEAFYGIPAVLIAECKSRIDKGLMTDVLDEFDHVLGRSVDTYSDEVDETQANQMIEAAIDQYYIQQDKNGMLLFMEVMVTRMQQAGEVIVPYITENPFMSEEQISKVKAGDTISLDHDVRLKIETVKDADEKEWIGVFTSSEEMHKGSAGNVQMNQSIESILRLALNWEQVNGIVINPFGKYIQMTKKMIELLINGYEYNENERKSKDDENN